VTIAYIIIAAISILLWLPILGRFYRSWADRRNPVSLAICSAILLITWTSAADLWIVTDTVNPDIVVLVSTGFSAASSLYAHAAFYWAKRHFSNSRGKA
jgi:hypothetical protein